ncbi:MAG: prepilin-type N-terminal cleavage/methylation domain-containing protein [Pirellulales bacterium]
MNQSQLKKGVRTIFDQVRYADSGRHENSSDPFSGFSLLEVVLALAILAGALAALGEVMRLGDQNAAAAADESQAEMLAESVMSELLVGARSLANVSGAVLPLEDDPPWAVSIEIQPTEYQELVAVRVSVAQQLAPVQQPARCDLVRWLPNPDYLPAATQQSSTQQSSSSTSSTTSGGQESSGE